MSKLVKYLKHYIWQLILLVILVIIQVQANLQLPDYMAKIVNEGIVGKDNSLIWHNGYLMLLISFIGGLAMVGVGFLASRVATGFAALLREQVFAKVESFSMTEFNKFSTASLITRSTNDIQQIQMVTVLLLRMILMAPFMGVGAIFQAYHKAPSMSWIIGLGVAIMFSIIGILFAVAMPKFKLLQKLVDRLNLVMRENLTGLRVIRAFNNENFEEKKFDKANKDLTNVSLFVNRMMVIMQPVMMMIFNLTTVLIIWVGAHLINSNSLQIGDMMAFMQYALQVIMAFLMISIVFIMIPRASVSANRIGEVLETEPVIKDPAYPIKDVKHGEGLVQFENVSFTYPGADVPALENISFVAEPGEMTAFIGSTGSGKTTLIDLVPRFYDPTAGRVLIDGADVRDMELSDLYAKIGYVPQKAVLFSGTIESNIKYGAPAATDEEVAKAVKTAQAAEFVDASPQKVKTPMAQGGTNVSGGQKQRLSIARAIVKKPEIYIFDDSFSALDFKTDAKLREALFKETDKKTVLLVGQRISTIMNADKIIVLDEGRIVGEGKHKDLLKNCEVYREIATSQLTEEELTAHLNDKEMLKEASSLKSPIEIAGKEAA